MNRLEAQAIVENEGYYDEEEIEDVMNVYDELIKNVGFEDDRYDNRYIVKFHDIFYLSPDMENNSDEQEMFDALFEAFCDEQAEMVEEMLEENNIDIDEMLSPREVGHYRAFQVEIPEITNENAAGLAMKIYDEFNYEGGTYVKNYIYTINLLKDLEDNYMDYWIEFLECNEFPSAKLKEIKENYKAYKERKK